MTDPSTPAIRASTYIVIPAYNEATTISGVVRDLVASWPRVVVIDDGSTDGTGEAALEAGAHVLRHAVNRGQGAALQTGFDYSLRAGARYLVTFDADGQHPSDELDRLLEPVLSGRVEVALGSRFLGVESEIPFVRKAMLRAAVIFTRAVSGLRITDTHNGLRALSREAAQGLALRADRMAHASEILDQIAGLGFTWSEVPVRVRYTRHSRRKGQRSLDAFRVLIDYLLGRVFR